MERLVLRLTRRPCCLLAKTNAIGQILLYAAFVPNGHAEAAVLTAATGGRRHVLIQERTPQQTRSLVVSYEGPGVAKSVSSAYYQVERWLPELTHP